MIKVETRSEKFKRLATSRTNSVLKFLHLIGNLSNKSNYDYSEEDIKKIFRTIEEQLNIVKARFQEKKRKEIKL
jgi:hypothetical protein